MTTKIPTPAEARARRTQVLQPAVADLTERVVTVLLAGPSVGAREMWVSTKGIPRRAVEIVQGDLNAAGWATRIRDDQRDGTTLVVWESTG